MKDFYFLLENRKPPRGIQTIDDEATKKRNVYGTIQNRERIEITIPEARLLIASSLFLKIVKKDDKLFILLDSLVPNSLNNVFLEAKIVLISYKIDNIDCAFTTSVISFQKSSNVFIIDFPEIIYRLQRRLFYRVQTGLTSMVFLNLELDEETHKLPVVDISEGGISFFTYSTCHLSLHHKYDATVIMPNGAVISSIIKIVNVAAANVVNKKYSHRLGAEFVGLDKRFREIIAKYVFVQQMEEIKKHNRDE